MKSKVHFPPLVKVLGSGPSWESLRSSCLLVLLGGSTISDMPVEHTDCSTVFQLIASTGLGPCSYSYTQLLKGIVETSIDGGHRQTYAPGAMLGFEQLLGEVSGDFLGVLVDWVSNLCQVFDIVTHCVFG